MLLCLVPLFPATAVAEPVLNVELGYGGRYRQGTDLLVQIEVVADRLIDGELQITSRNVQVPTQVLVPVEIAGGARKRFVAVFPTPSQGIGLTVSLVEGGNTLVSRTANLQFDNEDEFIGVLPSLSDSMPATASLAVPLGQARFFAIDESILSAGPGAISSLGVIIASANDLDQLSEPAQQSLEAWVEAGGRMIIDESPGPIPRLDITIGERPTMVGAGSVIASSGEFALGGWDGTIMPTAFGSTLDGDGGLTGEITGEVAWFGGPLANSLANDAGFGLPPLRVVLPFMAIYVLIVGPLAFLILRRVGRSGLLWVALPSLALLFTGAVWISGTTLRSNTSDAHGTIIEIENGTATAQSTVLRSSRNGGTTGITLQQPWQPLQTTDFRFAGPTTTSIGNITRSLDSTRVEANLDAGEFALFAGSGPAPSFAGALVVTAQSIENGVTTGTVTNQLDVRLDEVAVFSALQAVNIGSIEAGETVTYELSGPERDPRMGESLEIQVWGHAIQGNFFDGPFGPIVNQEAGAVNIELWSNFVGQNLGRVRPLGSVAVAGWTTELASPIDNAIQDGRTVIFARQQVDSGPGVITDLSSRRVLLRGPDQSSFQPGFGPGFNVPSAWRFDIDPDVDTSLVALELPRTLSSIEVWNGTEWIELVSPSAGLYQLPPGAFVNGSVFTKPVVDFEQSPTLGRDFALQTVPASAGLIDDLLLNEDAS